jgi:hypothetical protein
MTNNTPDYDNNLYFENNKIQATEIDDTKTQANLTEQWKKGELPEGWYWVKIKTWCECIDRLYYTSDIFLDGDVPVDNDKIIEVLAPVPSYDEWKASYNCMLENEVLRLKNAQLKKSLKECADLISSLVVYETKPAAIKQLSELWKKIDEVLK